MKKGLKTLLRPFTILVALAVLGGLLTTQVPIRADLAILLPERQSEELQLLHRALREGPANRTVMIAIRPAEAIPEEGTRFERLAALSRALKATLQETGEFEQLANGSFALRSNALQPFFKHRYHLNPSLDPASFTADGLGNALDRLLTELRSLGAPVIEEIMAADPTLRTLEVARLWRQSGGPRKEQGVWVGRDGTRAVLLARSKREAFNAKDQLAVSNAIDSAIAKVEANQGAVETSVSGPSIIGLESRQAAESESRRLLLWSVPLVALVLLLAFRRPIVLLASAVPLLGGFVAGTAAVAVAFGEVLAPTLGFGAILVGVGVDYPLHLFGHRRPGDPAWATAQRIWPSLLLGVATTSIGFLPLVFSSFPGVAQLGVFTITGLLVAAATSRWLLPWVVQPIILPPAGPVWDRIAPLHRGLGQGRMPALLFGAAAIGILAVQGAGLWQEDLRALSPIPEKTRQTDQALRQDIAATNPRYLLAIEGSDAQAVLARGEALLEPLRRLQEAGVLDGIQLAARYIPSANTQSAWLAALPGDSELRQRLAAAVQGRPFKLNTFEPFIKDLAAAKARGALRPDQIEASILRSRLETLMVDTDTGKRGFGFFEGLRDPGRLADAIAMTDVPGVRLLDLKGETEALLAGYRDETLTWVGFGAILGLAVLVLGLQRPGPVGRVGAAVAVSVLATAAILVLAGTALTLFHLLGLMVVAGLGLDYAIFLRNAVEDEQTGGENAGRYGRRSVCVCAATSVSVFAILAGAQIPMLGQLGETVVVGAVLSLIVGFVFTAAPEASRSTAPTMFGS